MTDIEKLRSAIENSGMTMKAIAEKSGMVRETLYNRLAGIGEFTAKEIVGLTVVLHLSNKERDEIFLQSELHNIQPRAKS